MTDEPQMIPGEIAEETTTPTTVEVDDLVAVLLARAENHEKEAVAQQGAAATLRELAKAIQGGDQ